MYLRALVYNMHWLYQTCPKCDKKLIGMVISTGDVPTFRMSPVGGIKTLNCPRKTAVTCAYTHTHTHTHTHTTTTTTTTTITTHSTWYNPCRACERNICTHTWHHFINCQTNRHKQHTTKRIFFYMIFNLCNVEMTTEFSYTLFKIIWWNQNMLYFRITK